MPEIVRLAEVAPLGLHQLTTWESPGVPVDTVRGPVKHVDWCAQVCAKIQADQTGPTPRRALIVQRPGKAREIAVFCDPAADIDAGHLA